MSRGTKKIVGDPRKSAPKMPKPEPVRYFKGRPVYSEEQTAQMDCPFPDESDWVAEIEKGIADRETGKVSANARSGKK